MVVLYIIIMHLGTGKSEEYTCTSSEPDFFCISSYTRCNCKRVLCRPSVRPWNDIDVATGLAVSIQELMSSPKKWTSYLVPYFLVLNNICQLYLALPLGHARNTITDIISQYIFYLWHFLGELLTYILKYMYRYIFIYFTINRLQSDQ